MFGKQLTCFDREKMQIAARNEELLLCEGCRQDSSFRCEGREQGEWHGVQRSSFNEGNFFGPNNLVNN